MAPRRPKSSRSAPPTRTLVLDNGGYSLKAGLVTDRGVGEDKKAEAAAATATATKPRVIPNCIARDRDRRTYVASELAACKDFGEMQFRRPVERGCIVGWEAQREIWAREFLDEGAPQRCDPAETRLVLAEPGGGTVLPALQANTDQMVFEEFGFASYYRANGPAMNAYHNVQEIFRTPRPPGTAPAPAHHRLPAEILMVIDSGYSHTTVTPVLQGRPINPACRRLDVGGKVMTNYLTRLLSQRHYDMRADPYIVNEIKEQACFVSLDFDADLERCWKGTRGQSRAEYLSGSGGIAKDYVLPDFHTRSRGLVRDHDPARSQVGNKLAAAAARPGEVTEDILTLRNERFVVPELLFHPSDIGLLQSGVASLVRQSLSAVPVGLWPVLLANILVVGGNAHLDGLIQRLQQEIVRVVPDDCLVRCARPADPVASTWRGAVNLVRHRGGETIRALEVTKADYDEYGSAWLARRFSAVDI